MSRNSIKEKLLSIWSKIRMWIREYWGIDDWIGLSILVIGAAFFSFQFPQDHPGLILRIYQDMHAEMIGIGVTVLILGNADEAIKNKIEKRRIISQFGSKDNGFALDALSQLKIRGWFYDGSLRKSIVSIDANLEDADFHKSQLEGSQMTDANFTGAFFSMSHMENSVLHFSVFKKARIVSSFFDKSEFYQSDFHNAWITESSFVDVLFKRAKLVEAILVKSNFQGADFSESDLSHANLFKSDFSGADFSKAHLNDTDLSEIIFDDTTIWDGALYTIMTKWPEGFNPEEKGCEDAGFF